MRRRLIYLILIALVIIGRRLHAEPTAKATKSLSSVELQWEENKQASKYQMQVFNSKGKLLRIFESKSSLLKFKCTSGKVKIRGRYVDAYGKVGQWSELFDVLVPPEPVIFKDSAELANKPIQVQASDKTMTGNVTLTWPTAAQAKKYQIKVYDDKKNLIKTSIVDKTLQKLELGSGSYDFSITAIGNDDVPSKEVYSPRRLLIGSAQIPKIDFKVKELDSETHRFKIEIPISKKFSITGNVEYAHHLAEDWKVILSLKNITDPDWMPDSSFKPGRYRISLWGKKEGWIDSDHFVHEFVIKPTLELQ